MSRPSSFVASCTGFIVNFLSPKILRFRSVSRMPLTLCCAPVHIDMTRAHALADTRGLKPRQSLCTLITKGTTENSFRLHLKRKGIAGIAVHTRALARTHCAGAPCRAPYGLLCKPPVNFSKTVTFTSPVMRNSTSSSLNTGRF